MTLPFLLLQNYVKSVKYDERLWGQGVFIIKDRAFLPPAGIKPEKKQIPGM